MGCPSTGGSSKGVLDWAHVTHVFVDEGVLSVPYVYVHRRRVSSRSRVGGEQRVGIVYIYIRVYGVDIYIHTIYLCVDIGGDRTRSGLDSSSRTVMRAMCPHIYSI
jgi:hypothetical protein